MSSGTPIPHDVEERVRTYLGAFLRGADVHDAMVGIRRDLEYWGDGGELAVFTAAHAELDSRLRIATNVEALVLHDDVGLPIPVVSEILAVPPEELRSMLRDALIELGEIGPDPSPSATPVAIPDGGLVDTPSAPSPPADEGPTLPWGAIAVGAAVLLVVLVVGLLVLR